MPVLNVVLIEPEIPQNTGNIARTCAATGARLHLVGPMGFTIDDRKLKRAGLDYWQYLDINYYSSTQEFFETTSGPYFYFTTKAPKNHSQVEYPDGSFLMFGKETKGLPEDLLLEHPERCVRIPMLGGIRSLNLSNAAAIGVYEALRQWDYPQLQNEGRLAQYKWNDKK